MGKNDGLVVPVANELTGAKFYRGPIDTALYPLSIRIEKRVLRFVDLSLAAPGTEITLGGASDVAIFSDFPIAISLGDPPNTYEYVKELRMTGRINRLFIRAYSALVTGRVVIFTGSPSLGPNFQREDPNLYPVNIRMSLAVAWGIGVTSLNFVNLALPDVFAREAHYLSFVTAERTAGTINRFYAVDTEIPSTPILYDHLWEFPTERANLYLPRLHKISSTCQLWLDGSAEAGGTTVVVRVGLVEV